MSFVQETGIVRFLVLFEKYGVIILITSFWENRVDNFYKTAVESLKLWFNFYWQVETIVE